MKKRKILVLFPLTALLLSGCSFADFKHSVSKSWIGQHLLHPVYDWIRGDTKKEEQQTPDTPVDPKPGEVTIKRIVMESWPKEVQVGYVVKKSEVSVRVYYSDNTNELKEPDSVACDTSKPGDAELTATYKSSKATVTIKVLDESEVVHVESIRWEVAQRTLHVGETTKITVTVEPANATNPSCSFVSDNESVLTVSSDGLVEAKAAGSAKVTITSNDTPSISKDVTFTVVEAAAGLPASTEAGFARLAAGEVLKKGEKINVAGAIGDKYYVMPTYTSGNNIKAVEISVKDEQFVIAEDQQFTVIDNGDGTIALMQANGKYLSAAGGSSNNYLKVVDEIDATAKFSYTVDEAGYAQLQAKAVERGYLCLNPNTQYGQPLFGCYKAPDNYEKYAIYHDGKGSSEHVDVEKVEFDKDAYSVEMGSSLALSATVSPALADDKVVSYEILSASPEGCVTLEGNVVTGVAIGEATIIAKSHENPQITATTKITVIEHIERNYGTLDNPLSIAEAKAVIDLDGGKPAETMYITGKVKNNDAYNSTYKNTNVWLTDGVNDFELYGALMPEGFEPAQPAKNDPALVGKKVVAHGTGKIYGTTYEFDKNCQIDSVTDEEVPVVTITGLIEGSATGIPGTIEQGKSLSVGNISVGVNLSDGSEGVTHPDDIKLETGELGVVEGKLIVGEFEYVFSIEVVAKVERNYGTLENPLSVSEALTLIEETCPNKDDVTEQEIYCIGTVSEKGTDKGNYYQNVKVSDGEKEVLIYSLNLTEEQEALFDVGKVIKFHGYAKNYNGTLEFATFTDSEKNKHFVSVDEVVVEVVPVTGIGLDREELAMEVGLPDETLVATIAPENATNKNVEWESSNPEVATVDGGVVRAVAPGEAVITVRSAENGEIAAECAVTVSEATKELVGIEVTTMPKVEYTEGEKLDLSEMVVTLHYSDQSSLEITSGWETNPTADHELTTEDTSLVVSYGVFHAEPIEISVSEKEGPVHDGTADDPYTIADCELVYADANLEVGKDIGREVYVKGTIVADPAPDIANGRAKIYISDSSSENVFYIHQANNVGGTNNVTLDDIPAGSVIVAKGTLKNYNGAMQMCYVKDVANCEFISIEKAFVAPQTVEITSGSELTVEGSMPLTATVGPYGCSKEVEWSIVSGSEYATLNVEAKTLTGVADGEVVIRATAVGYEAVYAEKTVTVTSTAPVEPTYYAATMAKGTQAYDDCTVNEKACIKIGTSKLGGDMTITVPAGATKLVVYAAAWKGVNGLSLNITANKTGVTTDPAAIALTADDGATSNSPFTLVGDESTFKFTIALSGVTEETVLTFATSAAKRCIVWGAQYAL